MQTNNSKSLAIAIATAKPETLASLIALLEETGLLNVCYSKLSDLAQRRESGVGFNRRLMEKTEELLHTPTEKLMLRLYELLNGIAGLPPRVYAAPRDFDDNCEELIGAALKLTAEHDNSFSGTNLNELVQHQTRLMFGQMEKSFNELTPEQQQRFMDDIRQFVQDLPEDQKQKLYQELNLDTMSDECLRKMITGGALGTAFAATVGISGFSFYMGATSLLASMAGLVGMTLPFGVYTMLTSSIAVLANPLFLLAMFSGGGFLLLKQGDRKIKARMLPLIVTSLVMSSLCEEDRHEDSTSAALALWQQAWQQVLACRKLHGELTAASDHAQTEWRDTKSKLDNERSNAKRLLKERNAIADRLSQRVCNEVSMIQAGAWGEELIELGNKLADALQSLQTVKNRPNYGNILDKLLIKTKKLYDELSVKSEIKNIAGKLVEEALLAWEKEDSATANPDADRLREIHRQREGCAGGISELEEAGKRQEAQWRELLQQTAKARTQLSTAESAFGGMDKIT